MLDAETRRARGVGGETCNAPSLVRKIDRRHSSSAVDRAAAIVSDLLTAGNVGLLRSCRCISRFDDVSIAVLWESEGTLWRLIRRSIFVPTAKF